MSLDEVAAKTGDDLAQERQEFLGKCVASQTILRVRKPGATHDEFYVYIDHNDTYVALGIGGNVWRAQFPELESYAIIPPADIGRLLNFVYTAKLIDIVPKIV